MRFSGKQPTYPSPKPTLKLTSHTKWWLQRGVGGRFPRGWNSEWARWSEFSAFWLATRADNVGPLGISRVGPAGKNSVYSHNKNKFFIDQACSVKMAVRWPRLFLRISWPRLRLGPRPIFSHIDFSLVNNAYIIQQSYADGRVTSNYSIVRVLFFRIS